MEKKTPYAPNNMTELPLEHYLSEFRAADPAEIAARTGCGLEDNCLVLNVLGEERRVDWPEFSGPGWKDYDRILFLGYLMEGHSVFPSDTFVSYSEMPWGEVYNQKFRARCISRLAGMLANNEELFCTVCERMGAKRVKGSGIVYEFDFMKNLRLRFIIWPGDEEFPGSAQILFSDNFPGAFRPEDRVVVCEYILGRMKKVMQAIAAGN